LTVIEPAPTASPTAASSNTLSRSGRPRRYLMCPPRYFEVGYAINPWMDPAQAVDVDLAGRQWDALRRTYLALGHEVELIAPVPGLPDMVFAANGGLVVGERALGASFLHAERQPEASAYRRRLEELSGVTRVVEPDHTNEGEGDFLVAGDLILAGTGFRTAPAAHTQLQEVFGLPVISLTLVDPRYYHLDTALGVLDDSTIAYYPDAFDVDSQQMLGALFPDAVIATAQEAAVLGLNLVSDGFNVVLPQAAASLGERLRERGFHPVTVDLSELLKAGGSVKCCTMELHRHRPTTQAR
jgi:N-dimethylarginine dimethylaminohydrolase